MRGRLGADRSLFDAQASRREPAERAKRQAVRERAARVGGAMGRRARALERSRQLRAPPPSRAPPAAAPAPPRLPPPSPTSPRLKQKGGGVSMRGSRGARERNVRCRRSAASGVLATPASSCRFCSLPHSRSTGPAGTSRPTAPCRVLKDGTASRASPSTIEASRPAPRMSPPSPRPGPSAATAHIRTSSTLHSAGGTSCQRRVSFFGLLLARVKLTPSGSALRRGVSLRLSPSRCHDTCSSSATAGA